MKKTLRLLTAAALISSFVSCGDKKTSEPIVAPAGMHVLELSKYGKPFVIFVPDTTAAKLTINEETSGALEIRVGKNFAVSILEQAADLEMRKSEIKDDEINKFKSFVVEEPNGFIYESEITSPEFHFILNMKIGNSDYSFEDIRSTESEPFGKETIQKMYDSAKNIKEVQKETNS